MTTAGLASRSTHSSTICCRPTKVQQWLKSECRWLNGGKEDFWNWPGAAFWAD